MNITASTQEPIFAQDIDLAVNIISSLNGYEIIFITMYVATNILKCYRNNCRKYLNN